MKIESVIFAIAGIFFGFLVGWQIGYQKSAIDGTPRAVTQTTPQAVPSGAAPGSQAPAMLDETQVRALRTVADRDPKNAVARAQLGNLYYDAGRYTDAIKWYGESVALNPNEVAVSTDLGVSYYYNNQPDLAIKQLEHSLQLDGTHTKTLLNLGVVRAFGKQDLKGATEAWRRLVEIAPESPEGRQAQQALDSLSSAHGNTVQ